MVRRVRAGGACKCDGGGGKSVLLHVHGNLHPLAVANDAQVNNFAGLDVAHAIFKVEVIRDSRAVHPDDHVVALAHVDLVYERHCQHGRWKEQRRRNREALGDVVPGAPKGMQPGGGRGAPLLHADDNQTFGDFTGVELALVFAQLKTERRGLVALIHEFLQRMQLRIDKLRILLRLLIGDYLSVGRVVVDFGSPGFRLA
jgi:hypothetical protein